MSPQDIRETWVASNKQTDQILDWEDLSDEERLTWAITCMTGTGAEGQAQTSCYCLNCEELGKEIAYLKAQKQGSTQEAGTVTQNFSGLPLRKFNELLGAGWQVDGVCLHQPQGDGTVRRGAVTTGGMVLWWPSSGKEHPRPVDGQHQGDCT